MEKVIDLRNVYTIVLFSYHNNFFDFYEQRDKYIRLWSGLPPQLVP